MHFGVGGWEADDWVQVSPELSPLKICRTPVIFSVSIPVSEGTTS